MFTSAVRFGRTMRARRRRELPKFTQSRATLPTMKTMVNASNKSGIIENWVKAKNICLV